MLSEDSRSLSDYGIHKNANLEVLLPIRGGPRKVEEFGGTDHLGSSDMLSVEEEVGVEPASAAEGVYTREELEGMKRPAYVVK